MSVMHVVVEDAGYDVGRLVQGVFSTPEKADEWIATKRAEYTRRAQQGGISRGGPSYDVEECPLDPDAGAP
ncbi:hypothetical protein M4V62_04255 [Streptomyces durmitorensis]|uniref:Uncharacterized protein n=1 Tax=Streptomyces durmitorensis TaxID=319947 RepID=A0ABY4PKU2_9ACTN|nr:hypothetical protein [Streptomyces durmitorensis]UQT54360.1 hypothetical protein M4V62_04255 [Streptomyces durmitorensis]